MNEEKQIKIFSPSLRKDKRSVFYINETVINILVKKALEIFISQSSHS